jgi:hypothetical protein
MRWKLLVLLLLASCLAHAKTVLQTLEFSPYIGVEYQYQHIKGTSPDWSRFMPSNFSNKGFFLGNKYHENFGIEIGYYHSLKKSQSSTLATKFGGVTASGTTLVIAQMRNKGFSIDWDIYYPLDSKFNIMAIVGFVTMHPKVEIYTAGSTNLGAALRTVSGRNKAIFRLGAGAELVEKNWGARMKFLWDDTQKLYLNVDQVGKFFPSITKYAFKQAITATFGLFYRF